MSIEPPRLRTHIDAHSLSSRRRLPVGYTHLSTAPMRPPPMRRNSPHSSNNPSRSQSSSRSPSSSSTHVAAKDVGAPERPTNSLHRFRREESQLRAAMENERAAHGVVQMQPSTLLSFAEEMVTCALDGTTNEGDALKMLTRAEKLLRAPMDARRKYNSDDWLNLCTEFVYTSDANEKRRVESSRTSLLVKVLFGIAQVCYRQRRYRDAHNTFLDAIAIQPNGEAELTPSTALNLLAIKEHIRHEVDSSLHIASNTVWELQQELEALLEPSQSTALIFGTLQQRQSYISERTRVALMLITGHLRLCVAAMKRVVALFHQAVVLPPFLAYNVHRVTLGLAEASRLCAQEVSSDEKISSDVAAQVLSWSGWLARYFNKHNDVGGGPERFMVNEADEINGAGGMVRWKYQVTKSRQFAASQPIALEGQLPALEHLYQRYPHCSGVALLLMKPSSYYRSVTTTGRSPLSHPQSIDHNSSESPPMPSPAPPQPQSSSSYLLSTSPFETRSRKFSGSSPMPMPSLLHEDVDDNRIVALPMPTHSIRSNATGGSHELRRFEERAYQLLTEYVHPPHRYDDGDRVFASPRRPVDAPARIAPVSARPATEGNGAPRKRRSLKHVNPQSLVVKHEPTHAPPVASPSVEEHRPPISIATSVEEPLPNPNPLPHRRTTRNALIDPSPHLSHLH